MHDGPSERLQGFAVETVAPAESTGAEIGSMSIVKGGPNPVVAREFYDWVLEPTVQQIAFTSRQFQLPSSAGIPSVDRRVPDFKAIKFIDYDYAKYVSVRRTRLESIHPTLKDRVHQTLRGHDGKRQGDEAAALR
jgi:iron(III) transport system substrate-binding protein